MRRTAIATLAAMAAAAMLSACDFGGGEEPAVDVDQAADVDAAAGALAPGALEGVLAGVGPGGDWKLTIDPALGLSLDNIADGTLVTADYAAPSAVDGGVRIGGGAMTAVVSGGPCESGVENVSYPFSVRVEIEGGQTLEGCLYRPWTTQIAALAPAVRACLSVSPGRSAVSYLRADGNNLAFMRVVGETGAEVDCTAALTGEGAPQVQPVTGPRGYPGERDALFYPAPGDNPGGECYVAPEVRSESGELLGWLALPDGC